MIQFDCHAHVYEQVAAIPNARYVPEAPASLAQWLTHQKRNKLRGGVIVQVSFLGTNNTELCAALSKLDMNRYAGVGVVELEADGDEMDRLVAAGVRGLRWNFVGGGRLPNLREQSVQRFLGMLRERNLHLEIHLEGDRLAPLLAPLTDTGVSIVVDHFGLPSHEDPHQDPLVRAVGELVDRSRLYFKFSAHYRTPFDLKCHAQALLHHLSGTNIVWGSDWPHTQHECETDYDSVFDLCDKWGLGSDHAAVQSLYGLSAE
ncbi:amidohydrolase family protein [uncultured Roseibium sp.]|uniref:amidohydrolase family protein n=1 Tax=uncultured Roseibium sp. TaxID=1936171 RepID=UPI00262E25AB|nr:amidohydrolase family protein [uncultured Roseibium sp.]